MLTWQRPWPRSPPRLREETDLDRLDEDPVRVVSETLQVDAAGACLFSYLLKAEWDGYSDGLVEAHDPKREMFGFPRLRALVTEHADEERSLGDYLMEELYSFVGEGWEQEDDITLLTLRRSATRT